MSIYQKLKELGPDFRAYYNTAELQNLIETIIQNPRCMIDDLDDMFNILFKLFSYKETNSEVVILKTSILDIFVISAKFDDLAWYLVENFGILSILFNEFYNETNTFVRSKMLKCFETYLLFEEFENKIFIECQDFCCNLGSKRLIEHSKIINTFRSIVESLISMNNSNTFGDLFDSYLSTLSLICRRYVGELSINSFVEIDVFKSFKKLMVNICESDKFSPVSPLYALSCFCQTCDDKSSFALRNSEILFEVIYKSITESNSNGQSVVYLYGTLLLNDILNNQVLVDFIRREWTVKHYKSICKSLIFECPLIYVEKMLQLFCSVKDIIPEWGSVIENYLIQPNSKFFEYLNSLTSAKCDRVVIMAWRVLQNYFQPIRIDISLTGDYCYIITNSVKTSLQAARAGLNVKSNSISTRNYLHSAMQALATLNMLITMTKHADFSGYIANIAATIQLVPFVESFVTNLIDDKLNSLLAEERGAINEINNTFCQSNNWFIIGSRLAVSLVYFGISMSFTHPSLICRKTFNGILMKNSFMDILVTCFTYSIDHVYIERAIVLMTISSQLPDYDVTRLGQLMSTNTKRFHNNCQNHLKHNSNHHHNHSYSLNKISPIIDDVSLKYQKSVQNIINSWMNNENKQFTDSEITLLFADEIKNLRDHQAKLENFIAVKDDYIRHSKNLANEYQIKSMNNESKFRKLMLHHVDIQRTVDQQKQIIVDHSEQLDKYKRELEMKDRELSMKREELANQYSKLMEVEQKYEKETERRANAEECSDKLRNLLAKSEETLKEKITEINRLQSIAKLINDLTGNKISPEALSRTGDKS